MSNNISNNISLVFAASCVIQFSYVEKYPEEPPLFEIVDNENLEDDQIGEIISLINEQV